MILFLNDLPPPHEICRRGMRGFFKRHNLDYADFLKNGIDSDRLLATDDAMATRAVQYALKKKGIK